MKFPRGNPDQVNTEAPLATGGWGRIKGEFRPGDIWIGRTEEGTPVGYHDDRHMVTIAGSRAGKGRSCIIPNLCLWPQSCVVIDPKGENAYHTAAPRARKAGHTVAVLDPFNESGVPEELKTTFNPLDLIDDGRPDGNPDAIDDAALIADALVVASDERDAHWDESARAFIEALILYVCARERPESGQRDLIRVRDLLMRGAVDIARRTKDLAEQREKPLSDSQIDPFAILLNEMEHSTAFDGVIAGAAAALRQIGERERGSILSTARRNTKFLDSPAMRATLRRSAFDPATLKTSPGGVSLYLCLPARRLASHARWLRLVINLTLSRMEALGKRDDGKPVLFVLDEFAVLGHMASLEKAAGLMAGYGVKLWTILQDLTQLQRHYEASWETFLGNAGLLQFFGNTDLTTLKHISERLGEVEIIRILENTSSTRQSGQSDMPELQQLSARKQHGLLGAFAKSETPSESVSYSSTQTESIQRSPLLTPEEVARFFPRQGNWQAVFLAGFRPIALKRTNYDEDAAFDGLFVP
ncbi:type IV secretory system conjugative DNA transfer family protein [Rhodovulum marinum]|uniref:Type IV secretion system protein VirD4 n=1 Tax=Rhodovulum marinum TaxID=320662 RepID=A0A4R2PQL3_9RHOB|nr:type IV secretory system conjugative DNA transfer family protein [Rhodovulum marinum]TCP38070.1 type IV secretion system protein VirD4 [Rhodovulum marinum]